MNTNEEPESPLEKLFLARKAIIEELIRRWIDGDKTVTEIPYTPHRHDEAKKVYIAGSGVMECPVCKTGKLFYSRSRENGHIHAQCTTGKCVNWME